MPARYEQLQKFHEAGEDYEINREKAALLVEPKTEGKSSCCKNH